MTTPRTSAAPAEPERTPHTATAEPAHPLRPAGTAGETRTPAQIRAAVDATRWPGVAQVPPCSRVHRAVARRILEAALRRLPLHTRFPDGRRLGTGGPVLEIRDPDAFLRRVGTSGTIGFGESYMAGEWDAPDLVAVLTVIADHAATLVPGPLQRLRRLWAPGQPVSGRNTPSASRENIGRHYDLSNDLFGLFLDETLSYSSAVFRGFPAEWSRLTAAQHRKIDRVLDLAKVTEGTRVLEIGTGWGELSLRAAARGAHVVSVTLSVEQAQLARERVREAGLADRVEIRVEDYRSVTGTYDAVVSVEMIEAVGAEFWGTYFATLDRLTAPGGRVALQAITMPHDRLLASRRTYTWIQKYIFPGGLLPSTEVVRRLTAERTRLDVARADRYGPHYAETLRLWRERFTERATEVDALGFDETFRRMWILYLAYSEAGFRSGYLDVQQFLLAPRPDPAGSAPAGTRPKDGPQ